MTLKPVLIALCLPLMVMGCEEVNDIIHGEVRNTRPSTPPPPDPPAPLDCKVECAIGAETGNCILTNATVSRPEYRERITAFAKLFPQYRSAGRIPKADVLALFDNPDDPCGRADVELASDNAFSNFSDDKQACYLNYESGLIGKVTLGVPHQISGKLIEGSSDEEFDITFSDQGRTMELIFQNGAINNSLGGEILEVNVLKTRTIVRTQTICLASAI